jgi:hypothetical protein
MPPNIAVQSSETPNQFLGADEDPMPQLGNYEEAPFSDPKVTAHKNLFYEQIERHSKTTTTRAMMSREEMDALVHMIKGDVLTVQMHTG